ncbi:hypothetical protein NUW54_g8169 [Trametes sanguinea]|uniref:Uncharacterized protein n=2 Tax=Trametes sanguinea TaxID=158606 RepID=A0ACC1N3P1_9APHY|nr:hypothetical protein NUW54_g12134 [Trametes sanguinea]KAJ2991523.1 hypothetical protein NUW54_g8169 [Trametes sanguinea]
MFVITPLVLNVKAYGHGTISRGLALAEADAAAALDSTPQSASAASHAPSLWKWNISRQEVRADDGRC